jgi:hypothetical protein
MRIFKQISSGGKVVLTLSLWGDDEAFLKNTKDMLKEILEELEKIPDEEENG